MNEQKEKRERTGSTHTHKKSNLAAAERRIATEWTFLSDCSGPHNWVAYVEWDLEVSALEDLLVSDDVGRPGCEAGRFEGSPQYGIETRCLSKAVGRPFGMVSFCAYVLPMTLCWHLSTAMVCLNSMTFVIARPQISAVHELFVRSILLVLLK